MCQRSPQSMRNDSLSLLQSPVCLRPIKFLSSLSETNFSKYQVNLMKVTKCFCLLFVFHSTCDCFGSVGFMLAGRSSLLCEVHLHTNPIRRLKGLFAWGKRSKGLRRGIRLAKMDAGVAGQRRTLRDFITCGVQGISSSIGRPIVEVNNFELTPALIPMVQ